MRTELVARPSDRLYMPKLIFSLFSRSSQAVMSAKSFAEKI
ncbi:hypothetical protein [Actinoplanes cyaneus]|nr:hypothetical protein [Actinoplanes cyaneus]